ncbi:MAG: primosomal protein N' [Candidatus Marinimicrobia bacterium]|nr:primosomal protein N' [Candidatus Neomarinimicrobiota bacterium]
MYCSIAFPQEVYQTFTYSVPDSLADILKPGMRVKAPFGPRNQIGYCVECLLVLPSKPSYTLKSISEIVDRQPIFTKELIKLITWISGYYLAPIGICFKAAHPSETGFKRQEFCFVSPDEERSNWPDILSGGLSMLDFVSLPDIKQGEIKEGISAGKLYIDNIFPRAKKARKVNAVKLLNTDQPVTKRQQDVINLLSSLDLPIEETRVIIKKLGVSAPVINKLIEKNILEKCEMEVPANPFDHFSSNRDREIHLSEEQANTIKHIEGHFGSFYPVLLHGVTGSGKTEIYIELAKKQLLANKKVLIMVPEIAITPQVAARFRSTFGEKVAIWHSQMTDSERLWTWTQIQKGAIHIVVGARSSLFAPMEDIGLIVVDEEQEASYKQDDQAPRYHARDAAVMYAHILNIPIVLGSASPSLESYYLSALQRYHRLELNHRFGGAQLPKVKLIDMLDAPRKGLFSHELLAAIHKTLEDGKQVIILQNRRGFNTIMLCSECQQILQCPSCSVALTYHKRLDKLMCHVCNATYPLTTICSHCNTNTLEAMGHGTQKIEEELQTLFPDARIARMDMDTTRTKHAHARILNEFEEHQHDILLGTQMIAKGLDFPDVTLVGIMNADTGMGIPDHRANERLFHLIYQVSGRSGRGKHSGSVYIQTFSPDEPLIQMAAKLELKAFYNLELFQRKNLNYPPFSRLFLLRIIGNNPREVEAAAGRMYKALTGKISTSNCIGPAPSPIEKVKDKTRWQILIKADRKDDPNGNRAAGIIMHVLRNFKKTEKGVKAIVNRDPISLM